MEGYDRTTYGKAFADVYDEWYADVSDVDATVATLTNLALDGGTDAARSSSASAPAAWRSRSPPTNVWRSSASMPANRCSICSDAATQGDAPTPSSATWSTISPMARSTSPSWPTTPSST
ncbi:MAG: hypothetical protein R2697_21305 [Ilumatobacteraceae bacterium]